MHISHFEYWCYSDASRLFFLIEWQKQKMLRSAILPVQAVPLTPKGRGAIFNAYKSLKMAMD